MTQFVGGAIASREARSPDPTLTVGIDLGATKMAAAMVTSAGRILARKILPTKPERGPDAVVTDLTESVRELCKTWSGSPLLGVGVAGQVALGSGRVDFAPNLRWERFPLGDRLQEALGLPVAVLNDVAAATLGEHEFGIGRGVDELAASSSAPASAAA